jgi:hypothetical protein
MSRLTLEDDRGRNYKVKLDDAAPLVRCDCAAGEVTCPFDTTAKELTMFATALAQVELPPLPAFRVYPILRERSV